MNSYSDKIQGFFAWTPFSSRQTSSSPTLSTDKVGLLCVSGNLIFTVFLNHDIVFIHAALDFAYSTLRLLPFAMRRNLLGYMESGSSFRDSVDALAKSFAAYVFCLAINEQGSTWEVIQLRTKFTSPNADFGPLWANAFRITTGELEKIDFLIPAFEGSMCESKNSKGFMILNVAPTVKAYKTVFGLDLKDFGLLDMSMEVDLS